MRNTNYIIIVVGDSNGCGAALTDANGANIPVGIGAPYVGMGAGFSFAPLKTYYRLNKVTATNTNINQEFIPISGRNGTGFTFGICDIAAYEFALAREAEHGNNGKEVVYIGTSLNGDSLTDVGGDSVRWDLLQTAIASYPEGDCEVIFMHVIGTNTEVDGQPGHTGAEFGAGLGGRLNKYEGWLGYKFQHVLIQPYPSGSVRIEKAEVGMNGLVSARANVHFASGTTNAECWTAIEARANAYAGVNIDHTNLPSIVSRAGGSHYNAETCIPGGELGAERLDTLHTD